MTKGGVYMTTINVTNFRKDIFHMLHEIIQNNESLQISTKDGKAILLSEKTYDKLMENAHHSSAINAREALLEMLQQIIKCNESISISTKNGKAVIISEEEYHKLIETSASISKKENTSITRQYVIPDDDEYEDQYVSVPYSLDESQE